MNLINRTILGALLLLTTAGAEARCNYSFKSIGNSEGLSSNCVKAITQDANGFMWFGTKNGLDFYDGVNVKRFNCYDQERCRGNNNISAFYTDRTTGDLWVGTDRGIYIYHPVSNTFRYLDARTPEGFGADDWIQNITADREGNVWILAPNDGIFRYGNGEMEQYEPSAPHPTKDHLCSFLYITSDDDVFIGTNNDGLYRFDRALNKFKLFGSQPTIDCLRALNITAITEFPDGRLVVGCQSGELFLLDPRSGDLAEVSYNGGRSTYMRSLLTLDDEIWVGTHTGVYRVKPLEGTSTFIDDHSAGSNGLTDNAIGCLFVDNAKNLWLGTMAGGACYMQRNGFYFERYISSVLPGYLSSPRVRGLAKDSAGRIWIGTEEAGINLLDPNTGLVEQPVKSQRNIVLTMDSRDGEVLVGYGQGGGLGIVDPANPAAMRIDNFDTNVSSVYSYLRDRQGNEWVGSDWGLYLRRAETGRSERVAAVGDDWVFDIFQDSRGRIWIASMGNGIWKCGEHDLNFVHYPYDEQHSNGLRTNSVSSVMEDHLGNIWFSTDRGGLVRYNEPTDDFVSYGIEEGLPDNVTYDILEDKHGCLWFGTNGGLVRFDPKKNEFKTYGENDGLLGRQFNYHAAVKGEDGYFYFGSMSGVVAFDPDREQKRAALPQIFFTDLRIDNAELRPEHGDLYGLNMIYTDRITLPFDVAVVSLDVAVPVYDSDSDLSYSYRIKPGSDKWMPMKPGKELTFTNLQSGDYTLEVKVSDGESENVRTLKMTKLAPWYATAWAYSGYSLAVIMLLFYVWHQYTDRKNSQLREKENLFRVSKEKELYENKVQFFAEIAHEIRTPLTLIDTPLEAIDDIGVEDARVERYLKVIRMNTRRLLDLTQQLLDFNKIGAQRYPLNFEQVDVAALVNDILGRFEPSMQFRNREVRKLLPTTPVKATIDREAVTKIISNLYNNALKYSASRISVELTADDREFCLKVTSDGTKIGNEERLLIFQPFYQINKNADNGGVGIGLPLSATLASLHNGSVSVQEDDSPDNTFVLRIPLHQEGVEVPTVETSPTMAEFVMEEDTSMKTAPVSYSLLLVEDNDEMRGFLSDQLSAYFAVETAKNGAEALKTVAAHSFDIIVTDIMMPEMDGYELCKAIKGNAETSHIPVVFLTAKNDLDSKVKALQCGGESYIEKPFSLKYFKQQVMSLLNNRQNERKAFLKKPFFNVNGMKMTPADEEFMNRVVKMIEDNMSNESFSVEMMGEEFCMSRSSLLRKIKTIFNLSPVELIRLIKLKKAAELIQEGKYRIGDVCYMVGINSSSYFSKLFYKQFGVTPKDFERECLGGKSVNITLTANPTKKRESKPKGSDAEPGAPESGA